MKKENITHTFESVWATFERNDKRFDEKFAQIGERLDKVGERLDKVGERLDKVGERLDKVGENFDVRLDKIAKERERESKDFMKRMKELEKQIGGIGSSNGAFAEEYFTNSFKKRKKTFFGEEFDKLVKGENRSMIEGYEDEYDLLLINGQSVVIIEIKYTGSVNDIPQLIRKAETFRVNSPEYKNHRVYLGMASMSFHKALEQKCKNNGIAVIKQIGDVVVVDDEGLKPY